MGSNSCAPGISFSSRAIAAVGMLKCVPIGRWTPSDRVNGVWTTRLKDTEIAWSALTLFWVLVRFGW